MHGTQPNRTDVDMNSEFDQIFEAYLAGELSAEQSVEFAEKLDSDPSFRAAFVAFVEETHELAIIAGEFQDSRPQKKILSLPQERLRAISAIAAVFLVAFLWLLWPRQNAEEAQDRSVAQLEKAVGVHWTGPVQPARGAALEPGIFHIAKGVAQFEFYSGAQVIVEGPAEFELISPYHARCLKGKIRARVPKQAQGFSIQTPSFELIDLGTEFGMDVSTSGAANVRVFDGEVEIHAANQAMQSVLGGQAIAVDAKGKSSLTQNESSSYPDFAEVQSRAASDAMAKLNRWKRWNESLHSDTRIVARFDFEDRTLDQGAIVGCRWAEGRWPGKGALEFRHTGDRVRVAIPGKFPQLTLMTWIRLDALPKRRSQALLLTDEYRQDHIHWQIPPNGGLALKAGLKRGESIVKPGQIPNVFDQQALGVWSHVCSTFSQEEGMVRHYLNGKEVSEHVFNFGRPLQIGIGDIGNWSVPAKMLRGPGPPRNFVGAMDEMTIWNAALSPDEIYQIYQQHRP